MQPFLELRYAVLLACRDHFDPTIREIPHPAAEPKAFRMPRHEPSKANALHGALDEPTSGHLGHAAGSLDLARRRYWIT